jgi:hypothetical protein
MLLKIFRTICEIEIDNRTAKAYLQELKRTSTFSMEDDH